LHLVGILFPHVNKHVYSVVEWLEINYAIFTRNVNNAGLQTALNVRHVILFYT